MPRTPLTLTLTLALFLLPAPTPAQVVGVPVFPVFPGVGGVYVDPDGTVRSRHLDATHELAAQRLRAKAANPANKPAASPLTYVSIPKVLAEVRDRTSAGKEIPANLKYLAGITQIRYVFVFPDDHDLVIAGPSEPVDASNPYQAVGKVTGRPVLHFDDLVNALRFGLNSRGGGKGGRGQPFGCAIDPDPASMERSTAVMKEHANARTGEKLKLIKEALGPQTLRFFGSPPDTRFCFVSLAADFKLKRMIMGVEPTPVPGLGNAVDSSRAAGNRFWFEVDYQPLLVSAESDAYEIRGQRLCLKAGALVFEEKGATETAKRYAKNFTAKFPQLAALVPAYADLQNVADLALLATLIREDRLDQKTGVDFAWWLSNDNYKVLNLPTPRTAETMVNYTNNAIVAGGVTLYFNKVASTREPDKDNQLTATKLKPSSDNWYQTKESTK